MSTVANIIAGAAVVMAAGGVLVAATLSEPDPPRIGEPVVLESPGADDAAPTPSPAKDTRPGQGPRQSRSVTPEQQQGGGGAGGGTIKDDDDIQVVRPSPRPVDDDADDDDPDDRDDRDDSRDGDDD